MGQRLQFQCQRRQHPKAPEIVEEFAGVPEEELPFSAGIAPDRAAIVKVLEIDDVFIEICRMRNRFRRLHHQKGGKMCCLNLHVQMTPCWVKLQNQSM